MLKKFAFDCWHNTVLCYTTHNTQHTIHNTQHKLHSWFIISFKTFFGLVKAVFWRYGLFKLNWFRDRRKLNSLLTATDDVC